MSDGLDELDRNGGGTNRCIGIISVELVNGSVTVLVKYWEMLLLFSWCNPLNRRRGTSRLILTNG